MWLAHTAAKLHTREDYDVRIGVDGFPINLSTTTTVPASPSSSENTISTTRRRIPQLSTDSRVSRGFNDAATLNGQRNKCICLEFLNNSAALCLFGTASMSNFDDELEFRFKADTKWADAHADDKAAVIRLWQWIQDCKGKPSKFLSEYRDYFLNDSPFAWYIITDYFMAVDNRAKNMMLVTWDGIHWMFIPYDMDTLLGERNDSYLKFDYMITFDSFDESQGAYCFAGHDSELWKLVRACPEKLAEAAKTIRANMSTEYVLKVFNEEMMGAWAERIYNKDGEYKYILPLLEQGKDYLFLPFRVRAMRTEPIPLSTASTFWIRSIALELTAMTLFPSICLITSRPILAPSQSPQPSGSVSVTE